MTRLAQQNLPMLTAAILATLMCLLLLFIFSARLASAGNESSKPLPAIETLEEHIAVYGAHEGKLRYIEQTQYSLR
ncbi:hypothetical protein KUV89_01685 [Marinobacter hydrocarbonoclasticus]|nr:hypothetical protein [Marinobacter nauticus]